MTGGRSRIVAAQAVVVGVLMVVVFLTLLRPDSSGPLIGVSSPGEPEHVVQHPADHRDGANRDHGEGGAGGRAVEPGQIQGGAPGTVLVPVPGAAEGSVPGAEAAPDGAPDGQSPTDDQYSDTLTRLTARLY
jgi:hypothetical protein